MIKTCKECGCTCESCCTKPDNDIHLHIEIENLKQKLLERDNHIIRMETNFLKESHVDNEEMTIIEEELNTWQDKYKRLFEAHKRVQRVNQGLEDKLLKLVDACETDKNALTKDVAVLSEKLAEANYKIKRLTESNERYKNDVNVAIQFLQCKQSNFVAHKFDSLPLEIQNEVSSYITFKKKPEEKKPVEPKSIKVPIPTFPPTAMFYSVPKSPNPERKFDDMTQLNQPVDVVSAAIMAKVLEERQRERMCVKHCDTCTCSSNLKFTDPNRYQDSSVQTEELSHTTFNDVSQNNFQIPKLPRNMDIANTKVLNFELENFNNIVKVQPNNFLVERSSSNASSIMDLDINLNSDPRAEDSNNFSNNVNDTTSILIPVERLIEPNSSQNETEKTENIVYQMVSEIREHPRSKMLNAQIHSDGMHQTSNLPVSDKNSSISSMHIPPNEIRNLANCNPVLIPSVEKIQDSEDKFEIVQTSRKVDSKDLNFGNARVHTEVLEQARYREMEENVKKFLFKKTELWKEQSEHFLSEEQESSRNQQTFSHTQTEI